jgi:hypothetical protein
MGSEMSGVEALLGIMAKTAETSDKLSDQEKAELKDAIGTVLRILGNLRKR